MTERLTKKPALEAVVYFNPTVIVKNTKNNKILKIKEYHRSFA
ncbi:hypothetical protein FSEG_02136 [Fusobacterium necrophorum D12]|nr:hypothetical protein FSEG_02136 [Fusobacterium necrophorum D12]